MKNSLRFVCVLSKNSFDDKKCAQRITVIVFFFIFFFSLIFFSLFHLRFDCIISFLCIFVFLFLSFLLMVSIIQDTRPFVRTPLNLFFFNSIISYVLLVPLILVYLLFEIFRNLSIYLSLYKYNIFIRNPTNKQGKIGKKIKNLKTNNDFNIIMWKQKLTNRQPI